MKICSVNYVKYGTVFPTTTLLSCLTLWYDAVSQLVTLMVVGVSIDRNVKFCFIGQSIEATCSLKNWIQTFATRLYTVTENLGTLVVVDVVSTK